MIDAKPNISVSVARMPTGWVRAMRVDGNWNENIGGASRTERPINLICKNNTIPRILDRSRAAGKQDDPCSH